MVKVKHRGLLGIGLNKKELKRLSHGEPIMIMLDDVGLPGQGIAIFHGDTNEVLTNMAKDIAERVVKVDIQNETGLVLPDSMKN